MGQSVDHGILKAKSYAGFRRTFPTPFCCSNPKTPKKMIKPLVAVLLMLPIVSAAEDHEMSEERSTESAASLEQKYCQIEREILAKRRAERRLKSMGNYGAAGRFGTERLLLAQESEMLTEEIKKQKPAVDLPQC